MDWRLVEDFPVALVVGFGGQWQFGWLSVCLKTTL